MFRKTLPMIVLTAAFLGGLSAPATEAADRAPSASLASSLGDNARAGQWKCYGRYYSYRAACNAKCYLENRGYSACIKCSGSCYHVYYYDCHC